MLNAITNFFGKLLIKLFAPDSVKMIVDVIDLVKGVADGKIGDGDIKKAATITYASGLAHKIFKEKTCKESEWADLLKEVKEAYDNVTRRILDCQKP